MSNDKCIICLEIKTDPVGIPCGHTFCQICLENYERIGKGTNCPLCRYPFVTKKDENSGIEPLNFSDEEDNSNGLIQMISGFVEEDNLSAYSEIDEDPIVFEHEVNFIDGIIEFDFHAFDVYNQENEESVFTNLEILSPMPPEVDSMILSEEDGQVEFIVDSDVEEESENSSFLVNAIEFDDMEESQFELYHDDTEYASEFSDDENDDESYEIF